MVAKILSPAFANGLPCNLLYFLNIENENYAGLSFSLKAVHTHPHHCVHLCRNSSLNIFSFLTLYYYRWQSQGPLYLYWTSIEWFVSIIAAIQGLFKLKGNQIFIYSLENWFSTCRKCKSKLKKIYIWSIFYTFWYFKGCGETCHWKWKIVLF
jgi:hypothetical protein